MASREIAPYSISCLTPTSNFINKLMIIKSVNFIIFSNQKLTEQSWKFSVLSAILSLQCVRNFFIFNIKFYKGKALIAFRINNLNTLQGLHHRMQDTHVTQHKLNILYCYKIHINYQFIVRSCFTSNFWLTSGNQVWMVWCKTKTALLIMLYFLFNHSKDSLSFCPSFEYSEMNRSLDRETSRSDFIFYADRLVS